MKENGQTSISTVRMYRMVRVKKETNYRPMTRNAQSCCRCRDEAAVQFVRCWFFRFSFLFYTNIYIFIFIHILLCASFYLRRCLFLLAPDTKTTSKLMDDPSESFHLPARLLNECEMRQKWAVLFLNGQPSTDEREKANIYGISTCGLVVEKTDFQAHTHTQKRWLSQECDVTSAAPLRSRSGSLATLSAFSLLAKLFPMRNKPWPSVLAVCFMIVLSAVNNSWRPSANAFNANEFRSG